MPKTNTVDKKVMELLEKLETLIGDSNMLENSIDEAEDVDEVIICLEDAIDEFFETIEVIEGIRTFLMELNALDEEEAEAREDETIPEDLIRIAEMIRNYERMSAEKRKSPDRGIPKEDSVAMLFYDADHCRVFPFEHVLRICPWLNDHSVMRAVPEMKDLYYLYEENTECRTGKGEYLVGPVVVIKLNPDHFLVTPDPLDRHRIRKFMKENTETVDFEEGASYEALRLV